MLCNSETMHHIKLADPEKIDPAVLSHCNSLNIILADLYAANAQEKTELLSVQIASEQSSKIIMLELRKLFLTFLRITSERSCY